MSTDPESRSTSGAAEYPDSVYELQEAADAATAFAEETDGFDTLWLGNAMIAVAYACTANICARLERIEAAIRRGGSDAE